MCLARKILLLIIICLGFTTAHAQRELLAEDRTNKNDTTPSFGINERNYFHFRSGIGLIVGPSGSGVEIGYGRSLEAYTGFRYKRKLSGMFSIGLEPAYKYTGFNISNKDSSTFLDNYIWGKDTLHNRHKIGLHTASLGAFFRINFDPRRGNHMGTYLDLGAAGDYIFSNEYITRGEKRDGTLVKTKFTRNPFISRFQYYYNAKLGHNWLALTFSYRPSPVFKNSYNFPALPRYIVGIELNR